jgi:putative flippase GtrA
MSLAYASLLAKILATGTGFGWNFLANYYWTFGAERN